MEAVHSAHMISPSCSVRSVQRRPSRQEKLACGIGRLERSDSAFANGQYLGACVSDSLQYGGQTPDRTELDDSSPLRPSGCLSSLPGWRCHRARAFLLLLLLLLPPCTRPRECCGLCQQLRKVRQRSAISTTTRGVHHATLGPWWGTGQASQAAISDSSLLIIDLDTEAWAFLLCSAPLCSAMLCSASRRVDPNRTAPGSRGHGHCDRKPSGWHDPRNEWVLCVTNKQRAS